MWSLSLSLYYVCCWFLLTILLDSYVFVWLFIYISKVCIPVRLFIYRLSVYHSNVSIYQIPCLITRSYLLSFWISRISDWVALDYFRINRLCPFVSLFICPCNVFPLWLLLLWFILISYEILSFLSLSYELVVLIVTVWTGKLRFLLLNKAWTLNCVNKEVSVGDGLSTLFTLLGPGLALLQMERVIFDGHIQLTILAKVRPRRTRVFMVNNLMRLYWLFTELACSHLMKLLLMILLEIGIVHLTACRAFLNVSSTVTEMRSHFGLGESLRTVVADLCYLLAHLIQIYL